MKVPTWGQGQGHFHVKVPFQAGFSEPTSHIEKYWEPPP